MSLPVIDSHAHLADERLLGQVDALLERARAAGVRAVVAVATDEADAAVVLELACRHPDVYATAGVHPHSATRATAAALATVGDLLHHPRVVAVGETGLDYHYDFSPRDVQREAFVQHLELARRTGKPLVVHAREADDDLCALLREAGGGTTGILHSFSSGRELLEEALGLGWYVSFSGMITFKNYAGGELVRRVPSDRLLVETDAPYLAPVPHRGRTNEPAYVVATARALAVHRGEDAEGLAERLRENACQVFGLPPLTSGAGAR